MSDKINYEQPGETKAPDATEKETVVSYPTDKSGDLKGPEPDHSLVEKAKEQGKTTETAETVETVKNKSNYDDKSEHKSDDSVKDKSSDKSDDKSSSDSSEHKSDHNDSAKDKSSDKSDTNIQHTKKSDTDGTAEKGTFKAPAKNDLALKQTLMEQEFKKTSATISQVKTPGEIRDDIKAGLVPDTADKYTRYQGETADKFNTVPHVKTPGEIRDDIAAGKLSANPEITEHGIKRQMSASEIEQEEFKKSSITTGVKTPGEIRDDIALGKVSSEAKILSPGQVAASQVNESNDSNDGNAHGVAGKDTVHDQVAVDKDQGKSAAKDSTHNIPDNNKISPAGANVPVDNVSVNVPVDHVAVHDPVDRGSKEAFGQVHVDASKTVGQGDGKSSDSDSKRVQVGEHGEKLEIHHHPTTGVREKPTTHKSSK